MKIRKKKFAVPKKEITFVPSIGEMGEWLKPAVC